MASNIVFTAEKTEISEQESFSVRRTGWDTWDASLPWETLSDCIMTLTEAFSSAQGTTTRGITYQVRNIAGNYRPMSKLQWLDTDGQEYILSIHYDELPLLAAALSDLAVESGEPLDLDFSKLGPIKPFSRFDLQLANAVKDEDTEFSKAISAAGSAAAPVQSVNGLGGDIVLDASSVGAAPSSLVSEVSALSTDVGGLNTLTSSGRLSETELNATIDAKVEPYGRTVESFGSNDADALEAGIKWARDNGGKLIGTPNHTYTIDRMIEITTSPGDRLDVDFNGSIVEFSGGGGLVLGSVPTAFRSTTTTGLTRGKTKFTVGSTTGVVPGDLAIVTSPVMWSGTVPLRQTYIVADVDATTIWVEGGIVGDMTPAQVAASPVTGDIVVDFYHPADRINLRNAMFDSPARDGSDTLVLIRGFRHYRVSNIDVWRPVRNGVYLINNGSGTVVTCTTKDHGYVTKDQGYTNDAGAPGGLSYGYGFIVANNYLTHFIGCHSYSGWHGFDAANGQTVTVFDGCVTYKDAFGFSTHEGSWILRVKNCHVLGGLGITPRSAEVEIDSCDVMVTLGTAINGVAPHRLVVKDCILDVSHPTATATPLYFIDPFPSYCYSTTGAGVEISGNTIIGMTGPSWIISRGDIDYLRNTFRGSGTFTFSSKAAECKATIKGNVSRTTAAQGNLYTALNLTDVMIEDEDYAMTVAGSNSAMLVVSGGTTTPTIVAANNVLDIYQGAIVRVLAGNASMHAVNNVVLQGRLMTGAAGSTIKALNNVTGTGVTGGVTVSQDVNNNILTL